MALIGRNGQTDVAKWVFVADGDTVTLPTGTWVIAAVGTGAPSTGILGSDTAVSPSGNDVQLVVLDTTAVTRPGIAAPGS